MKYTFILSFVLIVFSNFSTVFCQNNEAKVLLQKSANILKEHNYFAYRSNYKMKYFDSNDTISLPIYNFQIYKNSKDTILGYYANIYNNDEQRIYDGKNGQIDHLIP